MGLGHEQRRLQQRVNRARRSRKPKRRPYRPAVEGLEQRTLLTGFWVGLNAANPSAGPTQGGQALMLLSNGEMMEAGNNQPNPVSAVNTNWYRLTPDSSGNYVNGSWGSRSTMNTQRLYFPSQMLQDARVFAIGGEFGIPSDFVNAPEIYNAVTNTWTSVAIAPTPLTQAGQSLAGTPPFPVSQFGDDPIEILPNGDILAGYIFGPQTYVYHPATNTWRQTTGDKLRNDRSDEETWLKLPDGSVLSYDVFASETDAKFEAQRY